MHIMKRMGKLFLMSITLSTGVVIATKITLYVLSQPVQHSNNIMSSDKYA